MPSLESLEGKTFGNWEVIKKLPNYPSSCHSTMYLCKCVCGKERARFRTNLISGKNKGCGCIPWNIKTRPYEAIYNVFLRNAAKDNRFIDLTFEQFLKFTEISECHYCGLEITWAKSSTNKNGNNYNLDRKDNTVGYTFSNCVVCCARCNRAKSNHFTYEEWVEIGKVIKSWTQ